MIVETISLRSIRSYARLELALEPGIVLVTGPNGAGKTNLLEAVHLRVARRAGRVSGRNGVDTPDRRGETRKVERRRAERGRAASDGAGGTRVHTRPSRCREGRSRGPACVLRPRSRTPCAGTRDAVRGIRRGGRSAECGTAPHRGRLLVPRCACPVDATGCGAGCDACRSAHRDDCGARAGIC
ncbi:MAG: hypothetical protein E6G64_02410 [Actinobacteria bacterium]|nr:MAG: hypothetical protein E6G64_02410 [Actinomycetota bacterium]